MKDFWIKFPACKYLVCRFCNQYHYDDPKEPFIFFDTISPIDRIRLLTTREGHDKINTEYFCSY